MAVLSATDQNIGAARHISDYGRGPVTRLARWRPNGPTIILVSGSGVDQ